MREPEKLRTAGLIMAMFYERLAGKLEAPKGATAEGVIRAKMRHLTKEFGPAYCRGTERPVHPEGIVRRAPLLLSWLAARTSHDTPHSTHTAATHY